MLQRIADRIQSGDTVYRAISRVGAEVGALQYMSPKVLDDNRPATPRRVLHALSLLSGYGGALVRHVFLGTAPVGIHGTADAVSLASVNR